MTAETRYPARYFDGRTARSQDVSIALTAEGIGIYQQSGALLATWSADNIVLAERPRPEEPARIGLEGTTARLIVEDADIVPRLAEVAPAATRRIRTNRRTVLKVGAWAGLAIAAVAVIAQVLIPLLSAQLAGAHAGKRQTPDRRRGPDRGRRYFAQAAVGIGPGEILPRCRRHPGTSEPDKTPDAGNRH